jgi:excinuclease ABC subunit C
MTTPPHDDPPLSEHDQLSSALPQSLTEGIAVIKGYLKTLSGDPGVYRMLAHDGAVLYVGKARNLAARVVAYTQPARMPIRIQRMVAATRSMEFIITASEAEALLLECSLIKKLQPHYNILLRDDKAFPHIGLSKGDFPRLFKHRGKRNDKEADYFGPYASGAMVSETITLLHKTFQLRGCTDSYFAQRQRPCLEYHIKRCTAPCVAKVSVYEYGEQVRQARDFLQGRSTQLQQELAIKMQQAAEARDYELAATLRDRIKALTTIQQRQTLVYADLNEADVLAVFMQGGQACVQVFFFRDGQSYGNRSYFPAHTQDASPAEVLETFIGQFYAAHPPPKEILLNMDVAQPEVLAEALQIRAERKISISVPARGKLRQLVEQVEANAKEALERKFSENATQLQLLKKVAELFGLPKVPERIEIYDNSHVQGKHAIGAMVVAGPEGFLKQHYRTFTIKDEGAAGDDFAMMREVMRRRFAKMEADNNRPDLVLIDGGAGQLSASETILHELGVEGVPLVGIAKGVDRNAGREHFFISGREPFQLPKTDPVLYYLQRLRDEAHRFAIGTHRAKRNKATVANPLDGVAGIGPKRKKALLQHFGSARAVSNASVQELMGVDGVSAAVAEAIYRHFHD